MNITPAMLEKARIAIRRQEQEKQEKDKLAKENTDVEARLVAALRKHMNASHEVIHDAGIHAYGKKDFSLHDKNNNVTIRFEVETSKSKGFGKHSGKSLAKQGLWRHTSVPVRKTDVENYDWFFRVDRDLKRFILVNLSWANEVGHIITKPSNQDHLRSGKVAETTYLIVEGDFMKTGYHEHNGQMVYWEGTSRNVIETLRQLTKGAIH